MNQLAHLLLAGPRADLRLGAILGDHLKGRVDRLPLPSGVRHGIRLHRRIDAWTDRHPAVAGLRATLPPHWRRYGPVVLDVLYDHMLDRHWERLATIPLARFADQIDRLLHEHRALLPPRAQRFADWAADRRLWLRYGDRALLREIFGLLALRHGRPSPLGDGLALLDTHGEAIEASFLALFPDLARRAQALVAALPADPASDG